MSFLKDNTLLLSDLRMGSKELFIKEESPQTISNTNAEMNLGTYLMYYLPDQFGWRIGPKETLVGSGSSQNFYYNKYCFIKFKRSMTMNKHLLCGST